MMNLLNPRFNLVIENLLFSTSCTQNPLEELRKFQSRNRESFIFYFFSGVHLFSMYI